MSYSAEAAHYRRNALHVTRAEVLHPSQKEELLADLPLLRQRKMARELEEQWETTEREAAREAAAVVETLLRAVSTLQGALEGLTALGTPELQGKVETELQRLQSARVHFQTAGEEAAARDFGSAGSSVETGTRELWLVGGPLVVSLNQLLGGAAVGKEQRELLKGNVHARTAARSALERIRTTEGPVEIAGAILGVAEAEADGYRLASDVIGAHVHKARSKGKGAKDGTWRIVPPAELPTFADVGGLDDVKDQLRATVGSILERPEVAAKYRLVHNGILFYGPPGTGKTLLGRALAGEYGLRYLRFSPASIASGYIHEAAAKLQQLFEMAAEATPCVLFLDEVDVIASSRDDQPSADHREVVTQLMNSLEEYRGVPGLIIVAATNNLDRLDPGLREGRFDSRIFVPLPDADGREKILKVHLQHRGDAVDWRTLDLRELARQTSGKNAAALEMLVTLAAQSALSGNDLIKQSNLLDALRQGEARDKISLEQPVGWGDVVLAPETRDQIFEILNVFAHPELAASVGVKPPAGILLFGPPGTGKTTIAKAMATEVAASFYEQSAADLLSKWVGESEERVSKLFSKAKSNKPSIIFIDEIDSLLRHRQSNSSNPWEERVVGQFLRELDGLGGAEGVLLVGATNRIDTIDAAIQGRRLTPIEVGLPDPIGRHKLLEVLCRGVSLADDVDLKALAAAAEGMSGADLKRVRDAAGMKALSRSTLAPDAGKPSITMEDLQAALEAQRGRASLANV